MSKSNGMSKVGSNHVPGLATGGLRGLLKKEGDSDEASQKAVAALSSEYPIVAEILGGCPASGTQAAVQPGSITLYVRNGRLCWSAVVKSEKMKFYGEVADVVNPYGSINSAMLLGECSMLPYTEQKANYTESQEKAIL